MTDDVELQAVAQRFHLGQAVRFYPVAGERDAEVTKIRSEPWRLGDGQIVIKVEGRAGGVHVGHLELMLDRPRKAGHHCRHYSYEIAGPGKSGPRCAIGKIGTDPGAAMCCMPEPRTCCDFREESTPAEREAWRVWVENGVERLGKAVAALPKAIPLRTSGTVACPSCGGDLHYSRWQGGAAVQCMTPLCVQARFNIASDVEWPTPHAELIP